jgi:hypothetical protein
MADISPEGLGMIRPLARSKPTAWGLLALAFLLTKARGGASDTEHTDLSQAPWSSARPLAIQVKEGRSSFDIPTSGTESRTLVIVSALARQGGPFPIKLTAKPAEQARPIQLEATSPILRPSKALPKLAPIPDPASGLPSPRRTFHLLAHGGDVSRASSYLALQGRLAVVGRRIQVYIDENDWGVVGPKTLRDLVETFDGSVYPSAASRFGPADDVDRDGRFTVLFSSWLTRLAGGKTSVDGFVRGADLDLGIGEPFGNRCDMMYLSTALSAGPHLRTIVAHEYAHAVNFSRKALGRYPAGLEEEGWLDEGVAHLVEDSHGFSRSNIDYRVSAFLARPERYRLVVEDYYAADLFRSHGNRGATYLFLRWCVDRYGPGLLDSLVRSEDRGVENVEAATGSTFADLFRSWTVALARSGIEDSIMTELQMTTVKPGGPVDSWSAEATTVHYALIEGWAQEAVAIEVLGPAGADLQVTALRLPSRAVQTRKSPATP